MRTQRSGVLERAGEVVPIDRQLPVFPSKHSEEICLDISIVVFGGGGEL